MNKIYYLLFFLLILAGLVVLGVLAYRADQTDKFFEYQKSKTSQNYEGS